MYEVGQKLWYVPSHGYRRDGMGEEVIITKIGRKWMYVTRGYLRDIRINIDTLDADGGNYSSPGRCYDSQEAYEKERNLENGWSIFKSAVRDRYTIPKGITIEDISNAMEILKLKGD